MKEYELTILIHPELESDIEKALDKVRTLITSNDGVIKKEENWGKKKLAYTINREDFAVYVFMDLELPADAPLKISKVLNITDEVMRYLLVKVDHKTRKALAEQNTRDQEKSNQDTQEEQVEN